jgi:hypothetical protein
MQCSLIYVRVDSSRRLSILPEVLAGWDFTRCRIFLLLKWLFFSCSLFFSSFALLQFVNALPYTTSTIHNPIDDFCLIPNRLVELGN